MKSHNRNATFAISHPNPLPFSTTSSEQSGSDKAKLISRMAKMGQQIMPEAQPHGDPPLHEPSPHTPSLQQQQLQAHQQQLLLQSQLLQQQQQQRNSLYSPEGQGSLMPYAPPLQISDG